MHHCLRYMYFTSYELNKMASLGICGFITQLVEQRTGIRLGHGFEYRQSPDFFPIFQSLNPLTPVPPVTDSDEPWPFFHFWGIINTQLLHEEKIFTMMPRSEWSALWSLRYAQKNAQKVEWKTRSKISCHYTWLHRGRKLSASMTLS